MIKFLQLLTIDRPILSFLFANACSCFLGMLILFIIDRVYIYINYFFYVKGVCDYDPIFVIFFEFIRLVFRVFVLIFYSEIILKNYQNNWIYKFILNLKKYNILKFALLLFLFFCFYFLMFVFQVDLFFKIKYIHYCSLLLSYIILFVYWFFRDIYLKLIRIIRYNRISANIICFISNLKQRIVVFLNKYQNIVFVLTNLLCISYVFIYLLAQFYNFNYNYEDNYSETFFRLKDNYLVNVLIFNYAYQIIRYILIFKVFDIYSKMESGQVVDFIKKLKTSSKCRKVTSIVLFVIDTLFILLLSRGTSCNHCCIYWIMSYFFGLMSMYFVMFYYWHLENKHKDVLAEVEVKEGTGVL